MSEINTTPNSIGIGIETVIQFAAVLLNLGGMFLIKPDIFDVYQNGNIFLAGNYASYLTLILSVVFIYLSITFNRRKFAQYWILACLIIFCFFCFSYYHYNQLLSTKTTLLQAAGQEETERIIKGDNYLPMIQRCAESIKTPDGVVSDLEVIQTCADIQTPSELDKIWPKKEILRNSKLLFLFYSLSLMLGCISIITGVQAIKCKRNK